MEARSRADLASGVSAALNHYLRRLKSSWAPLAPPRFLGEPRSDGTADAFELAVAPETEAVLEREARRHHVSVSQILAHAVLTYLADRDREATSLK
jgi:hypothetical protein